jgi:hypothetical protein
VSLTSGKTTKSVSALLVSSVLMSYSAISSIAVDPGVAFSEVTVTVVLFKPDVAGAPCKEGFVVTMDVSLGEAGVVLAATLIDRVGMAVCEWGIVTSSKLNPVVVTSTSEKTAKSVSASPASSVLMSYSAVSSFVAVPDVALSEVTIAIVLSEVVVAPCRAGFFGKTDVSSGEAGVVLAASLVNRVVKAE